MRYVGWYLVCFVILLLIIVGCIRTEIVCNIPYIKVGSSCCLDTNTNSICDSDESPILNGGVIQEDKGLSNSSSPKITISSKTETINEEVIVEKPNLVIITPSGKSYSYTQNGYTLIIDDYTFESKTDWGTITDLTFILKNEQGSATTMPEMYVEVKD